MKLTRERKIIGAVLLIALGFLGYDQLRGGAGADEAASVESGDLLLASAASAASAATSSNKSAHHLTNAGDEISLASRLASFAQKTGASQPNEMRDAFQAAGGWLTKPAPAPTIATISPADKFVAEHKLSAISTNAAGASVAVVDGTLLHVGAAIDGYRLISVAGAQATFESSDGARAKLTLLSPPTGAQAAAR